MNVSTPNITEKAWQKQFTQLARTLGWETYHTFFSRWSDSGFPDNVLARERMIFAELKSENGKLTKNQERWIEILESAGAEVYIWRPSDWYSIVATLQIRKNATICHELEETDKNVFATRDLAEAEAKRRKEG